MARFAVRRGVRIGRCAVGDERARSAHRRAGGPRVRGGNPTTRRRGRSDAPSAPPRPWSSGSEAVDRADRELESWFESLAGEADRLLEHLEAEFGSRTPESLAEGELEAAGEAYFAEHATEHPATEQFLGGLIKKAVKLAKGVHSIVKRGVSADRQSPPHGEAVRRAASTGEPTAAACPPHRDQQVAGVSSRAGVAAREEAPGRALRIRRRPRSPRPQFDVVDSPNQCSTERGRGGTSVGEMEAEVEVPLDRYDAAGELDRVRARLVDQLMGGSAGEDHPPRSSSSSPW